MRELWAKELENRGIITAGEAEEMVEELYASMEEIRKKPKDEVGDDDLETEQPRTPVVEVPETAVPAERLVELNAALLERPHHRQGAVDWEVVRRMAPGLLGGE